MIPKYEVVIPAYNCAQYLRRLVEQVIKCNDIESERIIIVDDGSDDDGDTRAVAKFFSTRLIERPHEGPLLACRAGFDAVTSPIAIYCDSDVSFYDASYPDAGIECYSDSLNELAYLLDGAMSTYPKVAMVAPVVLTEETMTMIVSAKTRRHRKMTILDNRLVYAMGTRFGEHTIGGHPDYQQTNYEPFRRGHAWEWKPLMAAAQCYAVRMDVYHEIGGYDVDFVPGSREFHDDFCLRLRQAGYQIRGSKQAEVYHPLTTKRKPEGDWTVDYQSYQKSYALFKERWADSGLRERSSVENEHIIKVISRTVQK